MAEVILRSPTLVLKVSSPRRNSVFEQSFHVQQQFCEISQIRPPNLLSTLSMKKKKERKNSDENSKPWANRASSLAGGQRDGTGLAAAASFGKGEPEE